MKYTFRAGSTESPAFLGDSGRATSFLPTKYRFGGITDVSQARLFDSQAEALVAFAEWYKVFGSDCKWVELVAVEEIPGETTREVVPLEGVVDFDSLDGFVIRGGLSKMFASSRFLIGDLNSPETLVFNTLQEAVQFVHDYRESSPAGFSSDTEILGIRETTTKPTLKVRSLDSTYAVATD